MVLVPLDDATLADIVALTTSPAARRHTHASAARRNVLANYLDLAKKYHAERSPRLAQIADVMRRQLSRWADADEGRSKPPHPGWVDWTVLMMKDGAGDDGNDPGAAVWYPDPDARLAVALDLLNRAAALTCHPVRLRVLNVYRETVRTLYARCDPMLYDLPDQLRAGLLSRWGIHTQD